MSVEHSVSTGAPKATQGMAGAAAARKPAGTAEAGGFAALLMSLGADELPADPSVGLLMPQGQAEQTAAEGDDAALLAAGTAQTLSEPLLLPTPPAPPPTEQIRLSPTPAAGEGSVVSGVAAGARGRSDAPALTADTLSQTNTNTSTNAKMAPDAGLPAADLAEPVGEVQPLLRQAGWAQRLAQQRSQANEAARTAQAPRGEDIAARLGWQIADAPAPAGSAPQALLAAGLGDGGLRPFLERQADKNGPRLAEVGAFGGVAALDGARMDVPAVAPDAGLTTEMRVAEQVSYHVGRGAQSAELEIEGIDERPIHVSIDLQGQEARIEFRAEQAQTRQVLQDAMPHLREMLEREGLTLSGMSVGSSGPQGGQEQPAERGRAGLRQARVEAVVEGPAPAAGARSALPSGRSLDLYV
ncbi:MAG: flagellar hook-length control protein FliK [Hylemonella sp.]|uniref:flagellar hook-length control protein FliK n=1 Tax=Hylemonella sp. TaxID=2066020 RepID=UPI0022C384D5|nr:flagellar hook-length control protein FliK [Hylemonella sp.]MCZ8252671.1 flagellar hook-length control protein FliK [Hylemonella sp.]